MKFRTDFVTNSSSANYMTVTFNFRDSTGEEVRTFEEGVGWNGYFSNSEDGGLSFQGFPIKSLEEFFACLYYYYEADNNENEANMIPIFTSLFLFILEKISFSEMMERIHSYTEENEISLDWYPFDELANISPDDYENDEIIDDVINSFSCGETDILEYYSKLCEQNKNVTDIDSLVFYDNCRDSGEFMNHFSEELSSDSYVRENFPQINRSDPLFEKEVNKWSDILMEKVFGNIPGEKEVEFDNGPDVEAALESGDVDDCLNDVWGANTIKWNKLYLYSNHDIGSYEQDRTNTYDSQDYKAEHDFYFEINECIADLNGNSSYKFKHAIERFKVISKDDLFPKSFPNYPITEAFDLIINDFQDLLTKAGFESNYHNACQYIYTDSWETMLPLIEKIILESDDKNDELGRKSYYKDLYEILNNLLNTGIKLDYADAAHYIYNDTLETLYPLFDKGLKIDPSAYDDLITYAADHGKPEYTAWLLNRKNEAAQDDNAKA